ncbi:HNH endonuclease [Nonomuraea sp. NN258]|uniref:HNH endonuclease domain-containing protein n=1 Tax=Nonomuraea antri TaxID=2730852 RepID=UPI00156A6FC0|nr:HNH endonuclease domain-containing protein [Nonomuraea antri]NRQ32963.1 HNH endonuclease [Nonomuraea antri]
MTLEFFREEPTARSSWRLAVLMGANVRTYKFALGEALLGAAAEGRADILLRDLAKPYAMSLVEHLAHAPQASTRGTPRESDFLSVAQKEAAESVRLGSPTEKLLAAAMKSMPEMVMQKFHNLRGEGAEVPHRFYEVTGTSRERVVRLTAHLREVALSEQQSGLQAELVARWSIVETSFAAGVGRSLVEEGVAVDLEALQITDKQRRRSVTGVTEAVIGFQHGRCIICAEPLILGVDEVAVDHVFPYSFKRLLLGADIDLDAIWNLAPAHRDCNGQKSNRPPTDGQLTRLALRNEAIMKSPHPLKRTLQLSLKRHGVAEGRADGWWKFIQEVRHKMS